MAKRRPPARKLTVVVSAREGHESAVRSLRSVLADDAIPFDLVYLDIASPPHISPAVEALCRAHGGKLVRYDAPIAPALARKTVLAEVRTPYTLFVDNDVRIEPGSIARLVARADETGAGIVGPLYLVGDAERPHLIHMAGGRLQRDVEGALLWEEHRLLDEPLAKADGLAPERVDFVEYHCMLVRTDLVREQELISDDVLLVHEHIDLSLRAAQLGSETWVEPAARATYMAFTPRRLDELAFFQWRWSDAGMEESLAAFARRWPINPAFHDDIRQFGRDRRAELSALQVGGPRWDLTEPMAAHELAQTRTALREQAVERGYDPKARRALEVACDAALLLFDGLYRPDGRPFLCHAIGTASALVRYEFKLEAVIAGLLHAAYTHRADWMPAEEVAGMLAGAGKADAYIRALPAAKTRLSVGAAAGPLNLAEGIAIAIEAANDVDMRLSGEYRATGRPSEVGETGRALFTDVLGYLGAPGLAITATAETRSIPQGPVLGISPQMSFRLDAAAGRVGPVRTA